LQLTHLATESLVRFSGRTPSSGLFTRSARFYDLVYSWKDYQAEVAMLRERVGREGGSLLDVACGTGKHLELLSAHYRCEGVDLDPEMVRIARSRGLTVHQGDMALLDLGRSFDVVTCLFSSIGYVADLQAAVDSMARHLSPGGVLVVEPWLTPEATVDGHFSLLCSEDEAVKVARMSRLEKRGARALLTFHYLLGETDGVDQFTELHETWLRTPAEHRAAFEAAGLEASYDEQGPMGRGLWMATRPS
jgi:ubiquinone/menaquinone biosynthesis C-methylase UbiE